jgi:hypothetical protein
LLRHIARLIARLVVDYFAYAARPGASARHATRHPARRRLLRLRRTSGCFGTSHDLSCDSSSTTSPRAGSSSTTSPKPRVRVPRHVARLVVDYFTYAACPVCSAHHAACRVTHHRLVHLAQARRPLLRLRRASGCLGTSRGSSRGSSSTSSTTPHVWVPQHVARLITRLVAPLIVDYFAYTARLGASARHVAHLAARRRLLRLCRASGCLGTSRDSSRGSSSTTRCATTSSCGHTGSTSATLCVTTTCLATTLALLGVRRAPPRRCLPVASRRPFISTSLDSELVENGSHARNNWSESTLTSQLQQQPSRLHRRPPRLHQQSAQVATTKSFI